MHSQATSFKSSKRATTLGKKWYGSAETARTPNAQSASLESQQIGFWTGSSNNSTTCWLLYAVFASLFMFLYLLYWQYFDYEPKTYSQFGQDTWVEQQFPVNYSGIFLDIGANDGKRLSNTKLLEEHGWLGACADPFPLHFDDRTCRLTSAPITSKSGEVVELADCSNLIGRFFGKYPLSGIRQMIRSHQSQTEYCPTTKMRTKSVIDLLASIGNPSVIDYVSLDTEGSELDILQGFPLQTTCVRTWTIEHNFEEQKKKSILKILESQLHCHVKEVRVDLWAKCPCGDGVSLPGLSEDS